LLADFIGRLLEECDKQHETVYRREAAVVRARMEFKSVLPEQAVGTLKELLEDSGKGSAKDDPSAFEAFCDLGEMELARGHLGHSLCYLLHAKRLSIQSSSLMAHLSQSLGTVDCLANDWSALFETGNADLDGCTLISKVECNRDMASLAMHRQEAKRLSKQFKKSVFRDEPFVDQAETTAVNTDGSEGNEWVEQLQDQSDSAFFGEVNDNGLRVFAELFEDQNEVKQILKSSFSREPQRVPDKDSAKGTSGRRRPAQDPSS
jgi:hypothetical protein